MKRPGRRHFVSPINYLTRPVGAAAPGCTAWFFPSDPGRGALPSALRPAPSPAGPARGARGGCGGTRPGAPRRSAERAGGSEGRREPGRAGRRQVRRGAGGAPFPGPRAQAAGAGGGFKRIWGPEGRAHRSPAPSRAGRRPETRSQHGRSTRVFRSGRTLPGSSLATLGLLHQ